MFCNTALSHNNIHLCLSVAVKEISDLLNTGLDEETLKVCVQLLEAGVNPEALATVVRELRRETAALRVRNIFLLLMNYTMSKYKTLIFMHFSRKLRKQVDDTYNYNTFRSHFMYSPYIIDGVCMHSCL